VKSQKIERQSDSFPEAPVRKAIILAAGIGNRLRPFTNHSPKCLVEVAGVPILENALCRLGEVGTKDVVIVIGHFGEIIRNRFGSTFAGLTITYIESKDYATTNNIYSLWLARSHLVEDVLLLEADVFFERAVLERLLSSGPGNLAAVSSHQSWMSGTVVKLSDENRVEAMFDSQQQGAAFDYSSVFKTANLYLFRGDFLRRYFVPQLQAYIHSGDIDEYYESILHTLGHRGKTALTGVICDDLKWYEIDDESDRLAAEYLFSSPADRYDHVKDLHGSYWRFGFTDHAYLYNSYYPPQTLFTHFEHHLRDLVLNYPSGQGVVARLVGTLVEQIEERIVVANGASELIKIIAGRLSSRIICPVPSFNEYENAASDGTFIPFPLPAPSFELDVDEFATAAIDGNASFAIVVTPNNPTGLTVPRADLIRLATNLKEGGCRLVVDESFIDFSPQRDALTVEGLLGEVPNISVLKSLSKSFGIGGLRLGYIATADAELVALIRSELHIWNINSFAESFLRLAPRFRREFKRSCARVASDCAELCDDLGQISGMKVYKSEANFVLCRLPPTAPSGPEVAKRVFVEHNIFLKHCAQKPMPDGDRFLRIASRTSAENRLCVQSLARVLEG
jgi:histidinol-phosphate/aromatic aminotransferase/cobyric acid decarboxylase-like protein/CTP:phosphocholine cytidylyltransferase-like protein